MGSCCIGNNVLSLSPNNINEMFCIFSQRELFSSAPLQGFFLSCIRRTSPAEHTAGRNTSLITLDFSYFPCHPKISKRKLIRLALLLFLYYITFFFSKKGRAVKLTSDVIRIIPAVIAYRSISSKSIVAIPLP